MQRRSIWRSCPSGDSPAIASVLISFLSPLTFLVLFRQTGASKPACPGVLVSLTPSGWFELSKLESRAVLDELGHDPLLATRGRPAGVQRPHVRTGIRKRIYEEHGVAAATPMADAQTRKFGFAALVVIVEIQQKRDHALAALTHLLRVVRNIRIHEIKVFGDLLTHLVVQHRRCFEVTEGQRNTSSHAHLYENEDKIGIQQIEDCRSIGPCLMRRGLAADRVIDLCARESSAGSVHEPPAHGRVSELRMRANQRVGMQIHGMRGGLPHREVYMVRQRLPVAMSAPGQVVVSPSKQTQLRLSRWPTTRRSA